MSKKNKKLRHPWLDEHDPANAKRLFRHGLPGFWVPTPEEIEARTCELTAEEIRLSRKRRGGPDERGHYRPPKQATVFNQREEIGDDSQLCDCPYWGTEFKD